MKQLLVSDGTAPSFSSGLLAAGAVAVLKKSAAGLTQLTAGETITDTDCIQLVHRVGTKNIFSPWIPGRDVILWTGQSYTAQTAQATTLTFATTSVAAGDVTVKVTSQGPGVQQFKRKSWTASIAASTTAANVANAIMALMTGLPSSTSWSGSYAIIGCDFATASCSGAVITVTGTTLSIANNTELSRFEFGQEGFGPTGITTTLTVANTANPSAGVGDANIVKRLEESLWGNQSFYNRIVQPNTPTSNVVMTDTYDIYTLKFRNPVPGQINGVDNTSTFVIAYKVSGTDQANFEGRMNGYLASVPGQFAPVVL